MSFTTPDPTDQARDVLEQREEETAALFAILLALSPQFRQRIDELTQAIEQRQASGKRATPGWIVTQPEYRKMISTLQADIRKVVPQVATRIAADQKFAADLGLNVVAQSIDQQLPPMMRAQRTTISAVQDMIGKMGNGQPLERYLWRELGARATKVVREELIRGLVAGQNPNTVAREITKRAPEIARNRARLISRTEMLRSHRAASLSQMQANDRVVEGWIWTAAHSPRTCLSCLIMDGTFHTLDEELESHPGCRCSQRPALKPWSELGFTDIPQPKPFRTETGREWFMRQPEAVKLRMMGPAKYAAWRGHRIGLDDFTATKRSREWGITRYEPSLKQMMRKRAR